MKRPPPPPQIPGLCIFLAKGRVQPLPLPSSLLSSTRMISFSRCVGVWLTALWTDRRITDRASFTKMNMMDIWGSSLEYFSSLHLGGEQGELSQRKGKTRGCAGRRKDARPVLVHGLPGVNTGSRASLG